MQLIEACQILEQHGLPTPNQQCGNCHNTIYRQGDWFQCPDCGALSTQFGGLFTHAGRASDVWIADCSRSKAELEKLLAK